MKPYFVIEALQNKLECATRKCNKKCKDCPYNVDKENWIEALTQAIDVLESQKRIKREFFNSGIEYAKNEFAKKLEREIKNVGDLHKAKTIDDLKYVQVLGLQKAIEISEEVGENNE